MSGAHVYECTKGRSRLDMEGSGHDIFSAFYVASHARSTTICFGAEKIESGSLMAIGVVVAR